MEEVLTKPWVVVGSGRLGTALALAADAQGIDVRATWNRTEASAERTAELLDGPDHRSGPLEEAFGSKDFDGAVVWLTVVDDAVADVAEALADRLGGAFVVLHASGSLESRILDDVGIASSTGSLHPLLAVTDPEVAGERFGDCVWTVEGDERVRHFAGVWTQRLGATLLELEAGSRALYHASAVTAANLVVTLFDAALEMAELAGIGRDDARAMLLPLLASTVDNLGEQSTDEALSGPAAREDTGTIERHREALRDVDESLADIYDVLTERARNLGKKDE